MNDKRGKLTEKVAKKIFEEVVDELTDEELIETFNAIFKSVYEEERFYQTNMIMMTKFGLELKRRGYHIKVTQVPTVYHDSEVKK